jgi:hypothetical protein
MPGRQVVRDGFASFFFSPFLAGCHRQQTWFADLKNLIDGITNLGYTWVARARSGELRTVECCRLFRLAFIVFFEAFR